jgi:1,4-alpha-glucan branching enzyme
MVRRWEAWRMRAGRARLGLWGASLRLGRVMPGLDAQGARHVIKQTQVKGSDKVKVNFVLPKDSVAGSVSVVGDFNDWDPMVHPLRPRSNGTKSVAVTLPSQMRFAFRYLDEEGRWLDDDAAHAYEDNGIGGVNSVVHT